jgi:acetylglutamate kinase
MHVQANLKALRTAIPYIRAYKGGVFVVKLGGALCDPGRTLDHIAEQLALLHQVGIRVVLVHGAGEQATALARRLGHAPDIFAGRRITDDATLEVCKMAFAGTVNTNLLATLRTFGVPAVGLSGIDGALITANRRPVQTVTDPSTGTTRQVDFGHVGDIAQVNPAAVEHLLAGGYVPVVCSLASDDAGNILNVNADTIATRLAIGLRAVKYFLVTNVDGVMDNPADPGTLHAYLDLDEMQRLIERGVVGGGMLPKLAACAEALRGGVARVHIVNGTASDALLAEVFTNEGSGTLIVARREDGGSGAPA